MTPLEMVDFSTERFYDVLTINNMQFSASAGFSVYCESLAQTSPLDDSCPDGNIMAEGCQPFAVVSRGGGRRGGWSDFWAALRAASMG